jgi:predicted protein tyrosine phosphatase
MEVDLKIYVPTRYVDVPKSFIKYDAWYLVSIHTLPDDPLITPEYEESLKRLGCKEYIDMQFWDIERDDFDPDNEFNTIFTVEHAKQIIEFVDRVHAEEDEVVFVAHCDAGVSRSGAVGRFVTEYIGLDEEHFYKVNDGIQPNTHIYSTLKDEAGMNPYLDNFNKERFEK